MSYRATPLEALATAVALPNVFTKAEMIRTLRRNNGDVMRSALQLKEKHAVRTEMHYLDLHVGLPTLQEELRKGYAHFLDGACDSERCPVLLLQLQHFKPKFGDDLKLQRQGRGAVDGSVVSSLEDARRLCVYLMDLAVEVMEAQKAPGIVVLVDVGKCTRANLEAKMVTDILQSCKKWYPEVVQRILIVNGSAFTRGFSILLSKLLGVRTQQRIRVLSDLNELRMILPSTALPQHYGGSYAMMAPHTWMKQQAEVEDVDLDAAYSVDDEGDEDENGNGLEDGAMDGSESLNGMQYANISAVEASELPNSVLRGSLMRKKMDSVYAKHFAVLRPEALLLYESATSARPVIIIPVNHEVQVVAATCHDQLKGCGFRIDVPGVVGGHELIATSEQERGNWLHELQWAVNTNKEKMERREEREERRAKIQRDFEALDMINFDVELPVAQSAELGSGTTIQSSLQFLSTGGQTQPSLSPVASLNFGSSPQMSLRTEQGTVLREPPIMFGAENMMVQHQANLSMNRQPIMPINMPQPMMQRQQPMQMGTRLHQQSQGTMSGPQGMNVPVSSGYQLECKSLQEQLLSNFCG